MPAWLDAIGRALNAIGEASRDVRWQDKYGPGWREKLEHDQAADVLDLQQRQSNLETTAETRRGLSEQRAQNAIRTYLQNIANIEPETSIIAANDVGEPARYEETVGEVSLPTPPEGLSMDEARSMYEGARSQRKDLIEAMRQTGRRDLQEDAQDFRHGENEFLEGGRNTRAESAEAGRMARAGSAEAGRDRRAGTVNDRDRFRALQQALAAAGRMASAAQRDYQTGKISRSQYDERLSAAMSYVPEILGDEGSGVGPSAGGGATPPQFVKFRGRRVPFASLPPDMQARVLQALGAQ